MIKILVVDDSALMRRLLTGIFGAQPDMEVSSARDGLEALAQLHAFQPDVITLDVNMPQMDGLSCLDRIMLERPSRVVMLSALTEEGADITLQALQLGAVDFIAKPTGAVTLDIDELAPLLVEKVRMAARARLSSTARLTERVRLRVGGGSSLPGVIAPRRRAAGLPRVRTAVFTTTAGSDTVVLVGTSTGGPPALDALLAPLPHNFPWPIVVAQHMPAAFTGPLARRLDRLCALRVIEVTRPVALEAGTVFVGRGDADIIVSARPTGPMVMAAPTLPEHRWHPSVERLVATALEQLGAARLVGVLMTGMGDDGAAAMTRLRREGGRTIAEAEETAVVWGMPGELVRRDGADSILPVHDIADQLMRWAG